MRPVLIASDGSESALEALDWAVCPFGPLDAIPSEEPVVDAADALRVTSALLGSGSRGVLKHATRPAPIVRAVLADVPA